MADQEPDTQPPLDHRGWWTAALILCVALQVGVTIALPDQTWSMGVGLGFLCCLCAVLTIVTTPRPADFPGAWRWRVVTLGFVFWGVGWWAATITPALIGRELAFLNFGSIPRQVFFLIVLLPSGEEDQGWALRVLDVSQTLLMGASLTLLARPITVTAPLTAGVVAYLYSANVLLALLAITSFLTQRGRIRQLIFVLSVTLCTYAVTTIIAVWVFNRYGIDRNSPIWAFGDAAFIVYASLLIWTDKSPRSSRPVTWLRTSRHVSPLMVTAVLLLMALQISHRGSLWGALIGIGGLLIYAVRTTLLNDRYLAERDRLIALEAKRAHALIDIVHEIRSPLGSVVLNASLLARAGELPQPQRNWVDQIHTGGTRVTTLLNDILDLERLDAGLVDADLTECNPRTIAVDALAVVEGQARTFGVTLMPPHDSDQRVIADRGKLERVMVNLATNAIRFTPTGGCVIITIDSIDAVRTAITVTDTGSGISAAGQAVLFERFSHVGTPVNGIRGSGLGLSICRGLMTAMNGTLTIDSEPSRGTRAVVILPSATEPRRI
ncbi:sensor histidine kinase [Sphingomonas sp. Leaf339]|uniref:sensor histidine kinase n=1 Tax=Sphingomonas sp. Leaf339 TaxID=1736343 RepID=UPI0012E339A6|nr:HAMP domain-containing sensor histidine kinase [Sphingomonas sp. Leaf339]